MERVGVAVYRSDHPDERVCVAGGVNINDRYTNDYNTRFLGYYYKSSGHHYPEINFKQDFCFGLNFVWRYVKHLCGGKVGPWFNSHICWGCGKHKNQGVNVVEYG